MIRLDGFQTGQGQTRGCDTYVPHNTIGRGVGKVVGGWHQDHRVVVTQEPKPSGLRIREEPIQGDRPIVEYRHREALIEAARKAAVEP
jgi:hypothetical protein